MSPLPSALGDTRDQPSTSLFGHSEPPATAQPWLPAEEGYLASKDPIYREITCIDHRSTLYGLKGPSEGDGFHSPLFAKRNKADKNKKKKLSKQPEKPPAGRAPAGRWAARRLLCRENAYGQGVTAFYAAG